MKELLTKINRNLPYLLLGAAFVVGMAGVMLRSEGFVTESTFEWLEAIVGLMAVLGFLDFARVKT